MDAETYRAFREQWAKERDEAQAKATRLSEQIAQLDRTWRKLAETTENPGDSKSGSLASRVAAAVVSLTTDIFDSPEAWQAVQALNPGCYADDSNFRASVSNALKRLVDEGKLALEEAGAGKRPSRYRRLPAKLADGGVALSA